MLGQSDVRDVRPHRGLESLYRCRHGSVHRIVRPSQKDRIRPLREHGHATAERLFRLIAPPGDPRVLEPRSAELTVLVRRQVSEPGGRGVNLGEALGPRVVLRRPGPARRRLRRGVPVPRRAERFCERGGVEAAAAGERGRDRVQIIIRVEEHRLLLKTGLEARVAA